MDTKSRLVTGRTGFLQRHVLFFMFLLSHSSGSFLTEPTNVTISEGDSVTISCRVSGGSSRAWIINGQQTVETNLPPGLFAISDGLHITGQYTSDYSHATFQCYTSTFVGPPINFEFNYSTVGTLTVLAAEQQELVTITSIIQASHGISTSSSFNEMSQYSATIKTSSPTPDQVVTWQTSFVSTNGHSSSISTMHYTGTDDIISNTMSSESVDSDSIFGLSTPPSTHIVSSSMTPRNDIISSHRLLFLMIGTVTLVSILIATVVMMSCCVIYKKKRANEAIIVTRNCDAYDVVIIRPPTIQLERNHAYETVGTSIHVRVSKNNN